MQINSTQRLNIYNPPQKHSKPSFKSWFREVLVNPEIKDGFCSEVKHRNDTVVYRDGKFWKKLCNEILHHFGKLPKINIHCYGCSNGSEQYTLAMTLLSKFDEKFAKKLLPIIAKDYDPVAIEKAKSKLLPISIFEKSSIERHTGKKIDDFFGDIVGYDDKTDSYIYEVKPILTNCVKFSQADILEDYKKIEPKGSVVLARNFWPYLTPENRVALAKNLYNHLQHPSMVVVGEFDQYAEEDPKDAADLLLEVGFNPTTDYNIYTK